MKQAEEVFGSQSGRQLAQCVAELEYLSDMLAQMREMALGLN